MVGRVAHRVVRVQRRIGERRETRPVEVDAVRVHEVRVLARVHAARGEVDLPLRRVHPVDAAHEPRALRDLLLHLARHAVVEVQVIPPVPLRHPDDLLSVGQIEPVLLGRVLEKGRHLLVDDGARLPGCGVDLDDPVDLMAALVVLERDGTVVLAPFEPGHRVRVREERAVDDDLCARGDVEQCRRALVEHVARLVVEERRVPGLELILGRGLNVIDLTAVTRPHAIRREPPRVRRPHDRLRVVRVALGPIGAERRDVATADSANRDIVVLDECLELAVGRDARPDVGSRGRSEQASANLTSRPQRIGRRGCAPACVVRERAAPSCGVGDGLTRTASERELDGAARVHEGEPA